MGRFIVDGSEIPRRKVRELHARIAMTQTLKPGQSGRRPDVRRQVESLPNPVYTNDDIYAFEADPAKLYPGNRHIRDKIRQQLEVLRDRGLLQQLHRGVWRRV